MDPRPLVYFDPVRAIELNARRDNSVWFVFPDRPDEGNDQVRIAPSHLVFLELEHLASSSLVFEDVDGFLGELGQ